MKFEVEGDYEEDDDGNRTYQDTNHQQAWDALEKIRSSDFYEGSDFEKMDQATEVVNIEYSAKATQSYFQRDKGEHGTITLNKDALDGKLRRPSPDGRGAFMSLESVIVHEGQHAHDFNITSGGDQDLYDQNMMNLFTLDRSLWNDYPNQTEYNAVQSANAYRTAEGETLRSRYNPNTGKKGLADSVLYYRSPSLGLGRGMKFEEQMKAYNKQNPQNRFDSVQVLRDVMPYRW